LAKQIQSDARMKAETSPLIDQVPIRTAIPGFIGTLIAPVVTDADMLLSLGRHGVAWWTA
jgi:hypothetical protein